MQRPVKRNLKIYNDLYIELSLQGTVIYSARQILDELIYRHPLWRQIIVFYGDDFLLYVIRIVLHNLHKVKLVCGDLSVEFYIGVIVLSVFYGWIFFFLAKRLLVRIL